MLSYELVPFDSVLDHLGAAVAMSRDDSDSDALLATQAATVPTAAANPRATVTTCRLFGGGHSPAAGAPAAAPAAAATAVTARFLFFCALQSSKEFYFAFASSAACDDMVVFALHSRFCFCGMCKSARHAERTASIDSIDSSVDREFSDRTRSPRTGRSLCIRIRIHAHHVQLVPVWRSLHVPYHLLIHAYAYVHVNPLLNYLVWFHARPLLLDRRYE